MKTRKLVLYYAWNRITEIDTPLEIIENRFPTLFESRRMLYPRYSEFADPSRFEQGIGGFIDCILRQNFAQLVSRARDEHGQTVLEVVRGDASGHVSPLDGDVLEDAETLIVISFDSMRTRQIATDAEVAAVRDFLRRPESVVFVCPHHDIGDVSMDPAPAGQEQQLAEFLHHGDRTIPPQQRFGGFARSLLAGLDVPVDNRFGLRPAADGEGRPAPIDVDSSRDRLGLLAGVSTFNLHPHLPHLERLGHATARLDVLARQTIDLSASAHPFMRGGRTTFDALLQSRPEVFAGTLLVSDATLWSSTAGGIENLNRFWRNVLERPSSIQP